MSRAILRQLQGLLDGHVTRYQCEKRYLHAWGHSFWVLVTVSLVRDTQGQPLHLISQYLDISERKELERWLEHPIDHDFLTGLFNRRRFEQALAQETKSAARDGGRPILDLQNNRISQYELLVRLKSEQGEMLLPGAFLGVGSARKEGSSGTVLPTRSIINSALSRLMEPKTRSAEPKIGREFDLESYLESTGPARKILKYRRGEVVFSQGDRSNDVRYIQKGGIKLSVLSRIGKEAVVAMLSPGDFFGEGALAGQLSRIETATAVVATSVLTIEKEAMVRLLHEEPAFSDRFISYMLTRNMRIEADLVDQLFNSSEKRLARTLLMLARYGQANPEQKLPQISQETLAEMIGATRSRVNFFMNKFRKLGLIEYNDGLKINSALLSIVLHDCSRSRRVYKAGAAR